MNIVKIVNKISQLSALREINKEIQLALTGKKPKSDNMNPLLGERPQN
jgi:hypothetical protein